MTTRPPAIEARSLTKAFGGQAVLDGVDLEIATGECAAIVGANGAGKTTLLGCLASALRPDKGEVRWFGRAIGRDIAMRRSIGVVAHETGLYSHLTVQENLLFAARMTGVKQARQQVGRWLDATGLASRANALPTRLSRGMQQRVAVARAMIHDPPLLLLDEPFAGLDAAGTEWLLMLLDDLHGQGRTVCFVAHEREIVHRLAWRVVEVRDGKTHDVAAAYMEPRSAIRAA